MFLSSGFCLKLDYRKIENEVNKRNLSEKFYINVLSF